MSKKIDLIGKVFGFWKVINSAPNNKFGSSYWVCECICGNKNTVSSYSLRKGKSVSCGCRNLLNLTGQKFGLLTVVEKTEVSGYFLWKCSCDCGNENIFVKSNHLKKGNTKSCGCLAKQNAKIHGLYKHSFYLVWQNMKKRCCNPKDTNYHYYGGRGITVCDRWLGKNGFLNFKEDMFPTYKRGLTLDRANNNKGYFKENCRWITQKEQCLNRRSNKININQL